MPSNPLRGKEDILARLNPQKIYLENVRNILGVSTYRAQLVCEAAVRQGVFEKFVEVLCPDGVVAAHARNEAELPEKVHCWTEQNGDMEESEVATTTLPKVVFYRLK